MPMLSLSDLLNPDETRTTTASPNAISPTHIPAGVTLQHNVQLNRDTILTQLWIYLKGYLLEYPSTSASADQSIGHLFSMDKSVKWSSPILDFAYSSGFPRGSSNNIKVHPLVDNNGQPVLCKRTYTTCQGVKFCPFTTYALRMQSHTSATRESLKLHLSQEAVSQHMPAQDVFEKTLALYTTFVDEGCPFVEQQLTEYSRQELKERDNVKRTPTKARRGQEKKDRCKGRIITDYARDGTLFVRYVCEHYSSSSRKHLVNYDAGSGLYNEVYLTALLQNDTAAIDGFERDANKFRYGPLSPCYNVKNVSSQRVNCSHRHRGRDGRMIMTEMQRQTCNSKFTVFKPHEWYHAQCPRILIVCKGPHSHPPPLPTKTPALLRASIMNLLYSFDEALSDLTPHRLLRSPASQLFLATQVPHIKEPTFIDLHPSLANFDHLGSYIHHAQEYMYPEGTGWKGLIRLKEQKDATVDSGLHYIRVIREFNWPQSGSGDFEEYEDNMEVSKSNIFKLVLCMEQVRRDTGKLLKYRHIHSPSLNNRVGILHWATDQDRGQAKGLGLHLQEIARLEAGNKHDLHQPERALGELGPYDHVRRIIRLCIAHFFRNIHKSKASELAKTKMRSLSCVQHPDLPATIDFLEKDSKVSRDWIQDKITTHFAIAGLCQQESFIPLDIWQAGDKTTNIVEASHRDVNREGLGCSLVGGTLAGKKYELNKLQAQENEKQTGISCSYRLGHVQQSVNRTTRRKQTGRCKSFEREDKAILNQNSILSKALKTYQEADSDVQASWRRNLAISSMEAKVRKRNKAIQALQTARDTSLQMWKSKKGSGNVDIMLE
ncbi:hypothetical protein C8J56DRAFT_1048512 [Mycena floridula]|nr:hypothetical protein C8J56DRAFT_1048512 [Mycena floridula]